MDNFSKIKSQSISDLVIEKITNSIINGELSEGNLLPSENKLCEIFGVSRSILRESIKTLVSKGLVEVKQGYGTIVCMPRDDIPEEALRNYMKMNSISFIRVMEVRIPIMIEVSKLAARRRKKNHLEIMEETLKIMQSHSNNLDLCVKADEDFHKAIVDATENPIFRIIVRSIMQYLHLIRKVTMQQFGIFGIEEHRAIFEAIKNKEVLSAQKTMKTHMEGTLFRLKEVDRLLKNNKKANTSFV